MKVIRKKRQSRPPMGRKRLLITILWVVTMVVLLALVLRKSACHRGEEKVSVATDSLEQVLIPSSLADTVLAYEGYTAHFNFQLHVPNCVAYTITAAETLGNLPRQGDFACDASVKGCPEADDYVLSGFDRGHMAPAGDMKWSKRAMEQSFLMTNICPQNHSLNEGEWNLLEEKVREWAQRDSSLVVIAGPLFEGNVKTFGECKVAVPSAFFKVILAPSASPLRAIAFVMPNESCKGELKDYVTTVDEVERRTGFDFFSALPDEVEREVESVSKLPVWLSPAN